MLFQHHSCIKLKCMRFVVFGPSKDSQHVFPIIAMTDAAYSYVLFEKKVALDREHPLYKTA